MSEFSPNEEIRIEALKAAVKTLKAIPNAYYSTQSVLETAKQYERYLKDG